MQTITIGKTYEEFKRNMSESFVVWDLETDGQDDSGDYFFTALVYLDDESLLAVNFDPVGNVIDHEVMDY